MTYWRDYLWWHRADIVAGASLITGFTAALLVRSTNNYLLFLAVLGVSMLPAVLAYRHRRCPGCRKCGGKQ